MYLIGCKPVYLNFRDTDHHQEQLGGPQVGLCESSVSFILRTGYHGLTHCILRSGGTSHFVT